jgi:hypothetical protein
MIAVLGRVPPIDARASDRALLDMPKRRTGDVTIRSPL